MALNTHDFIENFLDKLKGECCLTYELSPMKGGSVENLVKKVQKAGLDSILTKEIIESKIADSMESLATSSLKDSIKNISIDAFVCTDSPLAILKQNSGLASIKLQQRLGKPVICTISMRDRNSLALSGEIMGLNDFDVRLFLALSGDPLRLGDQPQAKAVFEGNSISILDMISRLNSGIDCGGNAIKEPLKPIYAFSVINSYSKNKEILKNKMESKIKAGALALFTQPIYDISVAEMLLERCEIFNKKYDKNCVLMLGFFPVLRYKSAKFLQEKLPGVFIPNEWIDNLEMAKAKGINENFDYEKEMGLDMSSKLFKSLYNLHPKIHFMNNNNTMIAIKILRSVL